MISLFVIQVKRYLSDFLICIDDVPGSGEQEDKPDLSVTASASYTMTGSSGLNIDISLQRMSDNSVQMVCNMQETVSDDPEVEGSGESRLSSSSSFPSDLYLIKDIAVCNDLATAVGKDINVLLPLHYVCSKKYRIELL